MGGGGEFKDDSNHRVGGRGAEGAADWAFMTKLKRKNFGRINIHLKYFVKKISGGKKALGRSVKFVFSVR